MNLLDLKLHKYDFMRKRDFLFEIENELFISPQSIRKEDIIEFYKNQFCNDFNCILNNLLTIDGYSKINFYLSSLKKTIISLRNKIIGINFYLQRLENYINKEIEIFGSSLSRNLHDFDYLDNEQVEFKLTLDFDLDQSFYIINFFYNVIDCFSNELEEFNTKIENQLLSLKDILHNSSPNKLIIPNNIFKVFFTFLIENKLLKLETGKNINKTLAAVILPKYFLIEKEPNEEYANETIRKQLSLDRKKIKEDNLIQNLHNFIGKYTENKRVN